MDNLFTSKIRTPVINTPDKKKYLNEPDLNDTVDCLTLPEIDIPNESSFCHTQLPGTVFQSHTTHSVPINQVDARGVNTCNILSPEIPKLQTESFTSEETGDDNVTAQSDPLDPQSTERTEETIKLNKHRPITTGGTKRLQVPQHRLDADGECSDLMVVPSRDNLDVSNANKALGLRREITRPLSNSPFSKHVFDPPKVQPMCPKIKNTPQSGSGIETIDDGEVPRSVVYITKEPGIMYQLEFYTKNIIFSPLYVGERFAVQPPNDKKVQPPHYEYRETRPKNEMAMFYVRQRYAVSMDDNRPKPYKYALPPLRVYTDEVIPPRKRSASEANKVTSNGTIYFQYKGFLLRVRCDPLPISQIKSPVSEEILARMAKLNMPTSESRKNKGVVVGRCGYDVMQITFNMDRINLSRVELKGTAAVQTEDKMVYIREKSRISGRSLLLALPESTYFYHDPMPSIHRLHANFQRTNIMPLWKYELMQTRLAERRGASEAEAKIDRAFKQTRGSRLYFEGLDSLITAQGGLLCCDVPLGHEKYEAMMLNELQSRRYTRRRPPHTWSRKSKRNKSRREQSYEEPPDTAVSTQVMLDMNNSLF
ncbi:unnamed protein product [Echinostoma caproni]|uniref:NARG2_C domain-containing protein n=1 Tax=Echinostoma caproni TaxID=27848 RepID=A0A183AHP2_9TREM|nr:unnamed protein product [Echinostoma caproni]